MSKKLKRSAVALVLAATMVFSSQGVLTAFAVGENETSTAVDVSALEPILDKVETDVANESGNVNDDLLENGCEICGGVDGQHEEGCSANQQPENTCPVCGGVDGQHEEGCSANQQPDEGDSGETACPECGGVDGQHEENCSLAQKPDNTPSEEDVAAVQAVVDVINSLPTTDALANYTPTIELKPEDEGYQEAYQAALDAYYSQVQEQVKAARAAYDALTEEQKAAFDATVLAKLTALEELIAMREQADVLPETEEIDPDTVAIIETGEGLKQYKTLDDAVAAATDGATIEVLTNCTTTAGMNLSKNLTIKGKGADGVNPEIKFTKYGIALWGKALTFQDCKVTMNGIGSTPYTAEWNWMTISASTNASLTLDNVEMSMDASGVANSPHAIYFCSNNVLNIKNGSVLKIKNYPQDALEWDGGDGGYNVNITDSTFISDHNRSGFTGTFWVTAENSTVEVINSTGNGSNGSHFKFIDCNESNGKYVNFSNNGSHGLSAGNLIITNSDVTANGNGICGVISSGEMNVTASTLTIEENKVACAQKSRWSRPGALVISGSASISSDSIVSIRKNEGSGIYLWGENATLNMQSGDIQENHSKIQGGGIYNEGQCTLSSDVQIFNNHAEIAGDDLYNSDIAWEYNSGTEDYDSVNVNSSLTFGKVGSDWKLDGAPDCNHTITGWFDDSANSRWNAHTGPVHAELYEDATTAVTGVLALKAAHPYQYDPDAPTEPSEPVDWETSKSKTATNLDENYESQVTLSLPAAETVPVTDVVFVLDRSSSAGAARQEISDMMDNLLEIVNNSDAVINVGVVNFWYKADSGIELTALTSESIDSIKNAIMEGNLSGTNIEAGIDAAVAMLDASSTPAENKYMVLVTDGISHAWNDQNGEVKTIWGQGTADYSVVFNGANSYYYFDTTKTSFQTVFDTPSGDTQLNSNYEVPVFDAESVIEVLEDTEYADYYIRQGEYESYYSGVEKGVYEAAHAYANAASKYKCINLYWEVSGYPIASEFMEWTNEQGKCYNISDDLSGAFDEVEREITYVVDAGSQVIDVIGGDDDGVNYDYDFDFVDVVSLTVGGEELDFTKDGNTYYFGESRDGIYPFVLTYYPNGLGVATMDIEDETVVAGELFVWEINVPITIDKSVQLTYTVKLANPKTADGTYGQYDEDGSENYAGLYTNNSAVLFPVDSNGNVGEKEAFDKPTVSYTVSNGKPVEPTPDPDPDPDRPSRPNRDDDDDWEPLPDAPVKDKPTTEVDVPEETETPTTEQPDKYNPETGDTTTVFAAMALAAVSLGGVVLLGRKKK